MATAMLPGLGGGTGGVQLAPGQLANSTTAPLAAQNAAAATASGSVLLPNTSAPLLSAPGGAQPGATLPTPQINPNANFNNNVGGAAGTPVGSTGWSQYGYPGNPNNTSLAAFDAYNAKQPNINGGVGPNGVVPGTSMPASSTPPPTNLPTPQTQPTLQLGANGGLPPGLTPMPTVTQMMNTPQMNTAADFAAKYGTAATTPSLAQTTADKFNSLYSTPPKNTPTNTGEAQTAITDATTNQDQQNQDKNQNVQENFMDSYASMNPVLKTMFDQINTLLSQQNTRTSLVDEFTKLENDSGLQADKLSLMNMKNVMAGTEDDIRNEITKAGGFATNSQVMALTAARNKVLQSQATALQDAITTKEDYIKQIVTLTEADYAEADKQVSEQIGLDEKVTEMQINLDNAATQNYQDIVKNIGYDGLANSFGGNTQMQNNAESKLGLPKGALSSPTFLATAKTIGEQQVAATAANTAYDNALARERLNLDEKKFAADQSGGGGLTVTPQNQAYVQAFNNATAGMGAQSAKQAQAVFANYLNTGNLEGARDYIVRTALANAPADQQNQAAGRAMALGALSDISMMLAALKAKGTDTNLLTGTIVNVANKFGTSPDPELNAVGSRILQALITYRKGMTGVAFGPQEAKDYEKIFPDYTNTDQLNTTKIATLQDALNSNNKAALSYYIGADNYNALFPSLTNNSGGGLGLPPGGNTSAPDFGAINSSQGLKAINGTVYSQQKDGNWYPIK